MAIQQQKTEKIKKDTESLKAILDAERQKDVLEIDIQKEILEKEGRLNISAINNEMLKAEKETIADYEYYKLMKEAEANKALFTDQYVKVHLAGSMMKNTKVFFSGQDSLLGSLVNQVLGQNKDNN